MTDLFQRGTVDVDRPLFRALGRPPPEQRLFGVEHEFGVFRGGDQIDFREIVHEIAIDGLAIHPTNDFHYLTRRGSALIADGRVAEIATPPLALDRGFASKTADWAESSRSELEAMLPGDLMLTGGSTHLNVSTLAEHNDRLAILFARTFAPSLMLLMDQKHSPGMLVRPRPGRLELCGEYVVGHSLVAASVFAVGAVGALQEYIQGRGEIPPFLDAVLEPGRRRYGWYVDRSAFGVDLYDEGRAAPLRLAHGEHMPAGEYLRRCWELARPHARRHATAGEIGLVDRIVAGDADLPLEAGESGRLPPPNAPSHHQIGLAATTLVSPDVRFEPVVATWDWGAWEATTTSGSVVAAVSRDQFDTFARRARAGELDAAVQQAITHRDQLASLKHLDQLSGPTFFSGVEPGAGLMPNDRFGIGDAPASTVRPGKRDLPADDTTRAGAGSGVLAGILIMLAVVGLSLVRLIGPAVAQDVQDPRSLPMSVLPIDVGGELHVLIEFQQPWEGPPFDLFSYFFGFEGTLNGETVVAWWEWHDLVATPFSDRPMYVLDDGTVLANLGPMPTDMFTVTGTMYSGSWFDEATTNVVRSMTDITFGYDDLLPPDTLTGRTIEYDLLSGSDLTPPPQTEWLGIPTLLGDPPLVVSGNSRISDPVGDNQDYYGMFDSSRPDIQSVDLSLVEFGDDYTADQRLARLTMICTEGLHPGMAPICPADLGPLASATGWTFVDISFTDNESVVQAGFASADPTQPVFDGPAFDPNSGRNKSFEVFTDPAGYQVGSTTFDGGFTSGPSNDALAILRLDGVALLIPTEAVASCTNPSVFTVTGGGVDLVELPDTPGGSIFVGTPTVVEPDPIDPGSATDDGGSTTDDSDDGGSTTTDDGTTSDGSSSGDETSSDETSSTDGGTTPSGGSTDWPWLLIGLTGLGLIGGGIYTIWNSRDGLTYTPLIVGFEKGSQGSTATAAG